jgi:uncharacterized protein
MPNPFVIDTPAPADHLIDREDQLRRLIGLAEGGHNARLSAPRRYGKTTLLARLARDVELLGMRSVYVDLFGVISLSDLAARVEHAYIDVLKGPLAAWFAGVRRKWRVRGRAGMPGTGVELESLPAEEAEERLDELLDLPRAIHGRTGQTTVVVLDEFQEVLTASDRADAIIRSRIQHHRQEASYVFAGSHAGLMAELFGTRERPLYGQARQIALGPLPDESLARYIEAGFAETGRSAGPPLGELLALVQGHPQRAMLMAHHLWEATAAGATAGEEQWASAVHAAFAELQETFERYWERLSANERRVLAAVAWGGRWGGGSSLYAKRTLARFNLSKGTARDVSRELARRGDLRRGAPGGPYELVDPLLEAWVASGRRPWF